MPRATLSSKGQVTIPKEVRLRLRIRRGDEIDFVLGEAGDVTIRPVAGSARDVFGALRRKKGRRVTTLDQMKDSVRRRAARDDRRIRRGDS
jgi:AbrB family looped-hinge helix DNA binding protein